MNQIRFAILRPSTIKMEVLRKDFSKTINQLDGVLITKEIGEPPTSKLRDGGQNNIRV